MTDVPLIHRDRRYVLAWLLACLFLVAAMVVVGGYTRLSGSGLSITEWKPVHGVIPPRDVVGWWEEFEAYRQTPQYKKINQGMTLEQFKAIYWPEYFHRLLGRTVGFFVLLPLLIFIVRRSISRRLTVRLLGIFALGGLQGLIGWLMVKSGLASDPHVSPLRLALHLSLAFAIFALLLWTWLDIRDPQRPSAQPPKNIMRWYYGWFALLCLQIIFGALVAGLKAGLIYNTWPLMNGQWLPDELFFVSPWYENHALVQFLHRWLAVAVALGFLLWWYFHRVYANPRACLTVAVAIGAQFLLGVLTLLHVVPLPLALLHQAAALLVFAAAVTLLYRLVKP